MKTQLFSETKNVALCGAFLLSIGISSFTPGMAQSERSRDQNRKEANDNHPGKENIHGRGNNENRRNNEGRVQNKQENRNTIANEKPGNGKAYGYYRNHSNDVRPNGNQPNGNYANRSYSNGYRSNGSHPNGYTWVHNNVREQSRAPQWRYTDMPRRGAYMRSAPTTCIALNFRGLSFFFGNGVYYRHYDDGYRVVGAPVGVRIHSLPRGFAEIYVGHIPYYYYYGTYYRNNGEEYEVVRPPAGALVESIPNGYREMTIEGETYYFVDGVQYKPEISQGEVWYRVIKVQ